VAFRLSRTLAFHWAAVNVALDTAVNGVVHAMSGSDLAASIVGQRGGQLAAGHPVVDGVE
jgi:hypothetical protein